MHCEFEHCNGNAGNEDTGNGSPIYVSTRNGSTGNRGPVNGALGMEALGIGVQEWSTRNGNTGNRGPVNGALGMEALRIGGQGMGH